MLSTILVPLDGSPFSELALERAAAIARRSGAHLDLIRVMPVAYRATHSQGISPSDSVLDTDLRHATTEQLDQTAARLTAAGLSVSHALFEGEVVPQIPARVAERRVGLVVLATHGHTGWRRALLGSVAAELVRECPAAVLAVRAADPDAPVTTVASDPVVLPFDGSERDTDALELARMVAELLPAELVLLNVIAPVILPDRADVAAVDRVALRNQRASAEQYLERMAEQLRTSSIAVSVHTVPDDDPAQGIRRVATRTNAQLIAMVTRARGGSHLWSPGSVADRVLRDGDRDVLLVRSRG
jgi:nucleotide-binding universal stress UspA family protein